MLHRLALFCSLDLLLALFWNNDVLCKSVNNNDCYIFLLDRKNVVVVFLEVKLFLFSLWNKVWSRDFVCANLDPFNPVTTSIRDGTSLVFPL